MNKGVCHAPPVTWLFVYGTLMPGRLRWSHVSGDVVARRPATVAGTLYDTRQGYPALVLDGAGGAGAEPVSGWLLGFPDDRVDAVLDRLDRVEGPAYGRALVTAGDGTKAVTYEYLGSPAGFVRLDGAWDADAEDER
jgi:gamma-glutamylcyclotransferase (GGCT)/AIG2-like uncharacterized protein YtfP